MLRLPKIPQFATGKAYGPRIAPSGGRNCSVPRRINEATPMLAEKFILLMETLKSHASPDGSYPPVVSTSPHVPVKIAGRTADVAPRVPG